MRTLYVIPLREEAGGVHVRAGNLEMYFATVDDLRIALWRAQIDPRQHLRQLTDLQNGLRVTIPVTEAQWKALYS